MFNLNCIWVWPAMFITMPIFMYTQKSLYLIFMNIIITILWAGHDTIYTTLVTFAFFFYRVLNAIIYFSLHLLESCTVTVFVNVRKRVNKCIKVTVKIKSFYCQTKAKLCPLPYPVLYYYFYFQITWNFLLGSWVMTPEWVTWTETTLILVTLLFVFYAN